VLARLASQLAHDGYLVLGASETTTGASNAFIAAGEDQHGIFRLDPAATKTVAAA
jgi:chemotaxis methyl-accepting protein methylase